MLDRQKFFDELLSLQGKAVNLALQSSGERFSGKVSNVMFDSFILDTGSTNKIISFEDLSFLDPADS